MQKRTSTLNIRVLRLSALLFLLLVGSYLPAYAQLSNHQLSGYLDMNYSWNDIGNQDSGSFTQQHLNLINTFQISDLVKVIAEIEYENGTDIESGAGTGEIRVERGFIDLSLNNHFQLWFGKFLTPFGYYNLIHDATPAYFAVYPAKSLYGQYNWYFGNTGNSSIANDRSYAKYGTGINGIYSTSFNSWELKVNAYVINGRGPNAYSLDGNSNKGMGYRITLNSPFEDMIFGISGYRDVSGTLRDLNGNGIRDDITQFTNAFDVTFNLTNFLFRTEGMYSTVKPTVGRSGTAYGGYAELAWYATKRLTPYFRYDTQTMHHGLYTRDVVYRDILGGVNIKAVKNVFLKGEYHYTKDPQMHTNYFNQILAAITVRF